MQVSSFDPPPSGGGDADEGRLLAALRAGERRAAEALAQRTYRHVFATLCRLCGGDADLAADLTQETYRRAWSALASFRGQARFSTWLYRIAYTTFLNHLRRPRPLVSLEDESTPVLEDASPSLEEAVAARRDGERLRRAVLALPDELRFTVTARFWGGLAAQEIAQQEGVTAVAIRKRLKKAMGLLATTLEEES